MRVRAFNVTPPIRSTRFNLNLFCIARLSNKQELLIFRCFYVFIAYEA